MNPDPSEPQSLGLLHFSSQLSSLWQLNALLLVVWLTVICRIHHQSYHNLSVLSRLGYTLRRKKAFPEYSLNPAEWAAVGHSRKIKSVDRKRRSKKMSRVKTAVRFKFTEKWGKKENTANYKYISIVFAGFLRIL